MSAPKDTFERALRAFIECPDACTVWDGPLTTDGCPCWRSQRVTRRMYRLFVGEPVGSLVRTCDEQLCVNPTHSAPSGRRSGGAHWASPEVRFQARVRRGEAFRNLGHCWVWDVTHPVTGYGTIHTDGGNRLAHRWSWEFHRGPIAEGLQIDHLCRNRACVNPDHLEPVTPLVNLVRGIRARAGSDWLTGCAS